MSALILIVEDESELAATLSYNLQREGYTTRIAETGQEALVEAAREPLPDLVLLDLMLPDMSGTEICRRIRANPRTRDISVIMVTARGEEIDRVVGFEVGADDYVVKPFSVRELLLRVRAVLRRQTQTDAPSERLRFGELQVDEAAHQAWVSERELSLTALEFRLLTTLLERRGRVQTRDTLLSDVWNMDPSVTTRTVDKHVQRLRQKLGDAANYIETIRGVGYRFAATPQPE
ncbi:MAG: two-component system phosphate regulon response regulator PhoB [Myxococcota bacterium]|jgi:two-component system phosphate regulon response regulator PhoB